MIHPARRMVETLHAKGACPRIHVDLTGDGIVCPDFVREQWKEQLVIDLDPTYPLNLEFTEVGVQADLSFDGYVVRCTFPFDSIYLVADRDKGEGLVIEENVPESVRKRQPARSRPRLADARAEGKREGGAGHSRRRRRPQAKTGLDAAPEPTVLRPAAVADVSAEADDAEGDVEGDAEQPEAETKGGGEAEAQRRRSGFQVIDGDG